MESGQSSEPAAVSVASLLHDKELAVVEDALYTLSRIATNFETGGSDIQSLLKHNSPKIREEAAFTLGRLGSEAVPAFADLEYISKQDPNPKVRKAALNSLRLIDGGKIHRKPKDFSTEEQNAK